MKKIKLMLFIALFSFLIASPKVLAYNATVSYGKGVDIGIKYSQFGNANKGTYKSRSYTVTYGGKQYAGFCLDPDLTGPKNVTCTPYEGDEGTIWLLQQLQGASNDLQLLTFRMYGVYKDMMKNDDGTYKKMTPVKEAITRFLQVKDGNQEVINAYSGDPYAYLSGNTALIDQAFSLASQARSMGSGNIEEETSGSIKVGQKTVNNLSATYPLTSNAEIKPEYIDFECENCTILNKQWNGTTGTVTVTTDECDKEYNLVIVYKASTTNAYMCSGGKNTQTIFILNNNADEVKVPYPDKIACTGDPGCCEEDPIEPGWIGGNVNNCCEDGGNSEAHEYDLDKLFCRDEYLQVDYYKPKCQTDYYVQENTNLNEKYCKMYCTERVSVEIPGPITATSGRYFQLTTTSKGTKSPYIEGFKRCRIRVQYDIWEKDYRTTIDKEILNYNNFQRNEAWRQTYKDAVDKKQDGQTAEGKVQLKFKAYCKDEKPAQNGLPACKAEYSDSKTVDATIKYTKYPFSKFLNWYNVELDTVKRDNFEAYEIKRSFYVDRTKAKYSDKWSAYNFDYSDVNSKRSTYDGKKAGEDSAGSGRCKCTANWVYEGYEQSNAEKHSENVEGALATYTSNASTAMNNYNNAIKEAKQLEEDIDRCDNYFTKYEGANAEENYAFNTSMSFSYTQVYMDNDRGLQMDEQYIQFEDEPGCVITGPTPGPDSADKLAGKRYSTIYNKKGNREMLKDFGKPLAFEKLQKSIGDYINYLDDPYDADKIFTHDAKYRAECSWNEGENIYYTLSPNGLVSEGTDFINFTEHGQEYRLHLSTLDGTYETHWQLVGLGSTDKTSGKGKFDDFFMSQGQTCANESPSETSMLTCKIHVEYEIVLTGYCNGTNGTDTTVNIEDCDPYKEGYNLFSFKVVDPSNIFPNGYSTSAGDVGYNWSSTDAGKQAKNEIESRGKADKTYSQEFLTYSFVLSPTDMGHIKNYNAQANASGGYSDFNMNCNCSGGSCINCKSIFLNELANGNVTYDGTSHSVTGWSNKQTNLDGIRRKYGW